MAYEFLTKLFGTPNEDEAPRAMTADELVAAIDAQKDISVVDLKAGGYVSKEKFDAKDTELSGVKQQLDEANAEIQSYKDMDIEGIKQRAADWEQKYTEDTQALNEKLAAQERSHQVDRFFDQYKFTSTPAMRGIRDEFDKQDFKFVDGKFLGAEDFMNGLMSQDDYKSAFLVEEPAGQETPPETKPHFAQGTGSQQQGGSKKLSLTELMRRKNENPNYQVNYE